MKGSNYPWLAYFLLWVLLILCLTFRSKDISIIFQDSIPLAVIKNINNHVAEGRVENDTCFGRYIYIHDLPSRFNVDILKNCSVVIQYYPNMCKFVSNMGFGSSVNDSQGVFQGNNWYSTNMYMLDLIFHNKMKHYKCLTKNSSLASAIYVPYYAGLDLSRHLSGFNASVKDALAKDISNWLAKKPEWKYLNGKDHFLVAGRMSTEFRRQTDDGWGNNLFSYPQVKNMTIFLPERCLECDKKGTAIPYPSSFHPMNDIDVYNWQKKVRNEKRKYLYAFVGHTRPKETGSIRNEIIAQCLESKEYCKWFDCNIWGSNNCDDPVYGMEVFQSANFCLQPAGDNPTRRSTFDAIMAGCIPVFFRPDSAYTQYIWYLPNNGTKYSVLIPEKDIKDGKASIEKILRKIPEEEVKKMREEVVKLIPKTMYSNPMGRLERFEDAFDIAIKKVLERIEKTRKEMKESNKLINTSIK